MHEEVIELLRNRRESHERAIASLELSNRQHANQIAANNEEILVYNTGINVIDVAIEALEPQQ